MTVKILHGDCRDVLKTFADASVDSIVTDPPYHLTSNGGGPGGKGKDSPRARSRAGASRGGFMGMSWDGGDVAFQPATWVEVMRVLKPGGLMLAFGGTRTYHRLVCAIEDAGFEVRDMVAWIYGGGFPKGTDKAKVPDAWRGWNTALKPAIEPVCLARKPMDGTLAENLAKWGTGAMWIDGCRVPLVGDDDYPQNASGDRGHGGPRGLGALCSTNIRPGGGSAHATGRWPANVIHDGSDEVLEAFPDAPGQLADASTSTSTRRDQNTYGAMRRGNAGAAARGDSGSASRFFYCAKADRADRNAGLEDPGPQFKQGRTPRDAQHVEAAKRGNHHPTVKPTDLMRYLCRLVTPPGGTVLDPFMGSGSTLKAAELEGFSAIGIELEQAYIEIARRRIASDAPLFAEVTADA